MQANDVRVLKGAAVPTVAVGLIAAIVAAILAGFEGALGSVIGLGLVAIFFTVGLFVVTWAGRISPMVMFTAAVLSYLVKVIAIMITLRAFETTTVFDPKAFAWSVIVLTVVWTFGEMRGFMKLKLLYVEPDSKVPGQGN
ncbi:hypothetical protein [Herbidospora mongoliensis]|uniref:hypothetical protein n=1 Tax=Herbidospora mongoliensis TaxID=688067 RepID=UPI00082BAAF9|nr:hypothetical protein [Herbidospora mongoliensis]